MSGVAVMPTVGPFKGHLGMDSYQSEFTHEGEIAKPGFHKVKLTNYDVTAELTSTMRVGFHRYTFPPKAIRAMSFLILALFSLTVLPLIRKSGRLVIRK